MVDLFSESRITKHDPSRVYEAYAGWPALAKLGAEIKFELPSKAYRRVFVLGMGGSAAAGDILAGWLGARGGPELQVFKGSVPNMDFRDSLMIACSASGKTKETISMMSAALKMGVDLVSISSGGTVESLSTQAGIPHVHMPDVKAPRYMLPFMVFSFLAVVDRALSLGAAKEGRAAMADMLTVAEKIRPSTPEDENPSKRLAARLLHSTPKVYGSSVTRGAATRFKAVINENAKKHASVELMPELFHNEVEAWQAPSDSVPVFLRHSLEGRDVSERCELLASILSRKGVPPVSMKGEGGTSLSELVTLIYELDMASYYLAIGLGRDPMPTVMIDQLRL